MYKVKEFVDGHDTNATTAVVQFEQFLNENTLLTLVDWRLNQMSITAEDVTSTLIVAVFVETSNG